MERFKETFGVDQDINSFTTLVRRWEGGEQSVKPAGKTLRGLCFKVDYLPLPLVQDIFNLVNTPILVSILKMGFFQLRRECIDGLLLEVWRRLLSSAPDKEESEDVDDGEQEEEEVEQHGQKVEAEVAKDGDLAPELPAFKVC